MIRFSRAVTAVVLLDEGPCNHHRTDVHLLLPEIRRAELGAPNDQSSYFVLFGNGWQIIQLGLASELVLR